jgi:hypothetical protein
MHPSAVWRLTERSEGTPPGTGAGAKVANTLPLTKVSAQPCVAQPEPTDESPSSQC